MSAIKTAIAILANTNIIVRLTGVGLSVTNLELRFFKVQPSGLALSAFLSLPWNECEIIACMWRDLLFVC